MPDPGPASMAALAPPPLPADCAASARRGAGALQARGWARGSALGVGERQGALAGRPQQVRPAGGAARPGQLREVCGVGRRTISPRRCILRTCFFQQSEPRF